MVKVLEAARNSYSNYIFSKTLKKMEVMQRKYLKLLTLVQ